jgi:hypothetical protein
MLLLTQADEEKEPVQSGLCPYCKRAGEPRGEEVFSSKTLPGSEKLMPS